MLSITTHLMGGIGNQLFQVFNLISYGLTNKMNFFFEKRQPDRKDQLFYWDTLFKSLTSLLKEGPPMNLPLYKETDFHFNKLMPFYKIHRTFRFYGGFQSYKYFSHKKYDIFKLIKLEEQREMVKHKYISSFNNSISLHFRIRGCKKNNHNHKSSLLPPRRPVVSIVYYINALKYICEKTNKNDWTIIYFYEEKDREIVRQTIRDIKCELPDLIFISINTTIPDYEQLLLMSHCQHNIIANSTFSWWGAYFNPNYNKIVTYPNPDKWFGPAQDNSNKKMDDLFPSEWVKVMG